MYFRLCEKNKTEMERDSNIHKSYGNLVMQTTCMHIAKTPIELAKNIYERVSV